MGIRALALQKTFVFVKKNSEKKLLRAFDKIIEKPGTAQ